MNRNAYWKYAWALLLFCACTIDHRPIAYGEDQCHACKMMISDQRFGAELVTTKGKVFKYDAVECLIPNVLENGASAYRFILVTDFRQPGVLIDARTACFLKSPDRPSPMGGNLSAYGSDEACAIAFDEAGGRRYDWSGLVAAYDASNSK